MPRPPLSRQGRWQTDGLRVTLQRFKHTKKGVLKQPLNFQVAPLEAFGWTQATTFNDFDTLSRGQFSRLGGRQLLSFEMRTIVVDYQPTWVSWERARPNAPHPQRVAQELKDLAQLGSPMMFVARSGWWEGNDLRLPVTLRSVAVEERAGEIDARYFDLSFVEWREQTAEQRGYSGEDGQGDKTPATVKLEKDGRGVEEGSGKVVAGNPATLSKLALYYYGDPTLWRAIVMDNGIKDFAPGRDLNELDKNGKRVRKLHIPRLVDHKTGGVEAP
jgi:hypothetical protein